MQITRQRSSLDRRRSEDRTSIECLDKTSRLIDREEAGDPVEKHEQRGRNVLVLACRRAIPFYVDAFLSIKSVFFSLAWRCMRRRPRMRV